MGGDPRQLQSFLCKQPHEGGVLAGSVSPMSLFNNGTESTGPRSQHCVQHLVGLSKGR